MRGRMLKMKFFVEEIVSIIDYFWIQGRHSSYEYLNYLSTKSLFSMKEHFAEINLEKV